MTAVKHLKYLVEYLDAPDAEPRVVPVRVIMADRLAVEFHGRKHGLMDPTEQPQLTGFLWLYFAMLRQGDIADTVEFSEFSERCLDNQRVTDEPVPPTSESDGSASDSRSTSLSLIGSRSSSPETTG